MATLLSICQDAIQEAGFDKPSTIVGNTDHGAIQLLRCAIREGYELSRRHNWQILVAEHTFALDGLTPTQEYAVPTDFRWIVPWTAWDRTSKRIIISPVTGQEWQYLKGWTTISGLSHRARLRADKLEFEDTLTAADDGNTIAYEYLSKNYCKSSGGTGQAAWAADTDTPVLDSELMTMGIVWRFLRIKGLGYEMQRLDYEAQVQKSISHDSPGRKVSLNSTANNGPAWNVTDRDFPAA